MIKLSGLIRNESISKTIGVGAHFGNWVIIKIQSRPDSMGNDLGGVITLKNIVSGDVMPVQSDSGQWKATLHQQVMTDSTAIGLLNQIANNNKN